MCSVLTCREGTLVTVPDTTVREGVGEALATVEGGTVTVRGESFSTSDAVDICREETVLGGRL